MKTKIMLSLAALMVFGLAVVAVAYNYAGNVDTNAAVSCCCCHGDSCPMKNKEASAKDAASCCDGCECCHGDGASCPMMKKDADAKAMKMDGHSCPMMKKAAAVAGDAKTVAARSCPMKMKDANGDPVKMDAAHTGHTKHEMKTDGSGCCCACCQKGTDKDKAAEAAV